MKYYVVQWNGETHYDAGTGMTSSVVLCALHEHGPQNPPVRWDENRPVAYWTNEAPTCSNCHDVAEEFDGGSSPMSDSSI